MAEIFYTILKILFLFLIIAIPMKKLIKTLSHLDDYSYLDENEISKKEHGEL